MKRRDGLCLELHDPADHHRVINLWLLHRTATAAVLAVLRREATAGRARCTFDGQHPKHIIDDAPQPHGLTQPNPTATPWPLTHTASPPHRPKGRKARRGAAGDVCPQARPRPTSGRALGSFDCAKAR